MSQYDSVVDEDGGTPTGGASLAWPLGTRCEAMSPGGTFAELERALAATG